MSIFGGVDLLGEMTKSIEERGGAKKEAPSTSRKPRQRKSSSGSGLFGELEEGEDDIFAFSGKKRYCIIQCICWHHMVFSTYTCMHSAVCYFRCARFVHTSEVYI